MDNSVTNLKESSIGGPENEVHKTKEEKEKEKLRKEIFTAT